jgi:predicted DNA-binding antitoxin AbrB/MazE fold protein
MSITFEATYENGVLKPLTPVPFKEHEKVTVVVDDELERRASRVQATYGMVKWQGDPEEIRQVALDPEFSVREAP